MDNVCHTLVGAALGEAGLKRRTRLGNATLMIAANLPDVDVLVFLTDVPAVGFRRGWTHGILAQLVLPVVLAAAMAVAGRLYSRRARDGQPPLDVRWLLALSSLGVASHVFLDFLNNYGVRLLAPFDWRWFYGDAVFIIDPWLWLALAAGVWLSRRRGTPGPARGAVAFAAAYTLAMLVSAQVARGVAADIWREARGRAPQSIMVGPLPLTPITRVVIVDAGTHYETGTFSWRTASVTFDATPIPKNDVREAVAAARDMPVIDAYLAWARFPYWTFEQTPRGLVAAVRDVRFGGALGGRMAASTSIPPSTPVGVPPVQP